MDPPGLGELRLIGAVLSDGGHTTFTRRFLKEAVDAGKKSTGRTLVGSVGLVVDGYTPPKLNISPQNGPF